MQKSVTEHLKDCGFEHRSKSVFTAIHLKDCGFEHRSKSTFTAMKGVVEVKECPEGYSISFYCSKTDRLVSMFCPFYEVQVVDNAFAD